MVENPQVTGETFLYSLLIWIN